jgi:hypothetical protein
MDRGPETGGSLVAFMLSTETKVWVNRDLGLHTQA